MCRPAPVVDQYGYDVADRFGIPTAYNSTGPGGVFLGSVGDQAHATRRSSHNCAPMQESGDYHPDFAHAWDARPASKDIGHEMVRQTLMDPRVRYVLYADHGWYPDGTFEDITDNERWDLDHDTFHVSFLPGTHDDTRPFFTNQTDDLTEAEVQAIVNAIDRLNDTIIRRSKLEVAVIQKQHAADRKQAAKLADDHEAFLLAQADEESAEADIKRLAKDDG